MKLIASSIISALYSTLLFQRDPSRMPSSRQTLQTVTDPIDTFKPPPSVQAHNAIFKKMIKTSISKYEVETQWIPLWLVFTDCLSFGRGFTSVGIILPYCIFCILERKGGGRFDLVSLGFGRFKSEWTWEGILGDL